MGEQRKRYTKEFKEQTVKYIQEQVKTVPQIEDHRSEFRLEKDYFKVASIAGKSNVMLTKACE